MRNQIANKYSIAEGMCTSLICAYFCAPCSCLQIKNAILENENLTWACCQVDLSTESYGAPSTTISDHDIVPGIRMIERN